MSIGEKEQAQSALACWLDRRFHHRDNDRLCHLQPLDTHGIVVVVAAVIYLWPGEQAKLRHDEAWLIVEASDDGRFFATGSAWKPSGEWVGYGSLAETDGSLAGALAAAEQWAVNYGVPFICVQTTP